MRKILSIFLFLCGIPYQLLLAQDAISYPFNVSWLSDDMSINTPGKGELKVANVKNARYSSEYDYLPLLEFTLNGRYEIKDLKIEAFQFAEKEELQLISQTFEPKRLHLQSADGTKTKIFLVPFQENENGEIVKIESGTIDLIPVIKKKQSNSYLRTTINSNPFTQGTWLKFAITKSGMYKLTYDQLSSYGIPVNDVDPATLQIFGNGGKMLPQPNSDPRPDGLIENAIFVSGESDQQFNQNDYLLFYAEAPNEVLMESEGQFTYHKNIYSDTSFYFLTFGNGQGKRIKVSNNSTLIPGKTISDYVKIQVHEEDKINSLNSGRLWYADKFQTTTTREYTFDATNPIFSKEAWLQSSFMTYTLQSASYDLSINDSNAGKVIPKTSIDGYYSPSGVITKSNFSLPTLNASSELKVKVEFNKAASGSSYGYTDYILLAHHEELAWAGDNFQFSQPGLSSETVRFQIANGDEELKIWQITDPDESAEMSLNEQDGSWGFNIELGDSVPIFIAFKANATPSPIFKGRVTNQNLRGMTVPDLLVITDTKLKSASERLANYRSQHSGISVKVVEIDKIFNEFSSGMFDVTAVRDFIRHLYQKGGGTTLKNVLMFGKGSFNYKNIGGPNRINIPIYTSRESLDPVATYSSDDYFTFMDDDEGEWIESSAGDHIMDIGIGRIPATTLEEANGYIDKIMRYEDVSNNLGDWKNKICLIADDEDGNLFQNGSEQLFDIIDTLYSSYEIQKIYIDAFEQEIRPSGESSPATTAAIMEAVENGVLILNYVGHGSEFRLAEETIIDFNVINAMKNLYKMPLMITATCEFGRHDNPYITSGAEEMLFNFEGGAIALFTTSRPVFADSNEELNEAFFQHGFSEGQGNMPPMGSIIKDTKNNSLRGINNRNFILLGDPSMKLAQTNYSVQVDEESLIDTLGALTQVNLKGAIYDSQNTIVENFDGTLKASFFDKIGTSKTLGTNNIVMEYKEWKDLLYKGNLSVDSGKFELTFNLPKNIDYQVGDGKLFAFASSTESEEASGANFFKLGGSESNLLDDNQPPVIRLFVNDTLFESGGLCYKDLNVLAHISDFSGLNLNGSTIGSGLTVMLDDEQPQSGQNYFIYDVDSYTSGWLQLPLYNVSPGMHTITLVAKDIFNNTSRAEIDLLVSDQGEFRINNITYYPNPVQDELNMRVEHSRGNDDIQVYVEVFTAEGNKVFDKRFDIYNSSSIIDSVKIQMQELLPGYQGIVIIRTQLTSLSDGAKNRSSDKVFVSN